MRGRGGRVVIHGREAAAGDKLLAELGDRARLHLDKLEDPARPPGWLKWRGNNLAGLTGW